MGRSAYTMIVADAERLITHHSSLFTLLSTRHLDLRLLAARRRRSRCRLHLLRLEVDGDVDVVAEEDAAVVEGFVPVDAVVLAIDRRGQREAGLVVAPRVAGEAEELDRERDLLCHAAHGQIA